jgi:hypothetical protein
VRCNKGTTSVGLQIGNLKGWASEAAEKPGFSGDFEE